MPQVDKADENSQRLETYDAMRKTTESEREAEDQIMEQSQQVHTQRRTTILSSFHLALINRVRGIEG